MAWEWSHTNEAYEAAQKNLAKMPKRHLMVIFAEWEGQKGDDLDQQEYETALKQAVSLPKDTLVDYIWNKMEEQRTCDNGGFDAWCCPFGCLSHKVSFS